MSKSSESFPDPLPSSPSHTCVKGNLSSSAFGWLEESLVGDVGGSLLWVFDRLVFDPHRLVMWGGVVALGV